MTSRAGFSQQADVKACLKINLRREHAIRQKSGNGELTGQLGDRGGACWACHDCLRKGHTKWHGQQRGQMNGQRM